MTLAWRIFREEVTPHSCLLGAMVLLTMLMGSLTAAYPVVIKKAIDMFTAHDRRILYQVPLLVMGVTGAKALAQYGQNVAVQTMVMKVMRNLQKRMFAHTLAADVAWLEREAPAQWSARFTSDALAIREALTRSVNALGDVITLAGLVVAMVWMDWELSLAAIVLYPLASVPVQRLGRAVRRSASGAQEQMGQTAALLTESFALARQVRTYGLEAHEEARAGRAFARLHDTFLRIACNRARLDPMLEVIGGAAIAFVLGFAGWRAATGGATLGGFTAFVAALFASSRPLRSLGSLNTALQEGMGGMARVFAVIDEPPAIRQHPGAKALPPGQGTLRFEHVCHSYDDGRSALEDVSFEIPAGTMVAFAGPSGAGKSTLLSLVPRLHDPSSGRIMLDGTDISTVNLPSLRASMAYVCQETALFDMSVRDNILLGRPTATLSEFKAACAAAAIDFLDDLPGGADFRVGPDGQRLSGGQAQRVALARALVRQPRLLLLDEATSALDAATEARVLAAITAMRAGRTTLLVAHRHAAIKAAQRVIHLEQGKVVEPS
ncbi:ABC transporter ATP-binding protein [Formicincola oecophyllae]|uniref:ABC transporter ATP-binding protein n=2 Tax=Formicincola oecophyllae TaxID=2558361 RepID=A0A4Y6U9X9_9PROT|nr:ABC transporter ATP-binding protein [Formicincola oecophyllae]